MKIYVAGPLSSDTTVGYMKNVGRMIQIAVRIWQRGHYPYIPALDCLVVLAAGVMGREFSLEDIRDFNMPWVKASDAMYVIGHSAGTDKEIAFAEELDMPIYWDLDDIPAAKKGGTDEGSNA